MELAREVALLCWRQAVDAQWPREVWSGDNRPDYYLTPLWFNRREFILSRDEHQCQFCNSTLMLRIHHRTYERFGCELPKDLITVCSICHSRLHGYEEKT